SLRGTYWHDVQHGQSHARTADKNDASRTRPRHHAGTSRTQDGADAGASVQAECADAAGVSGSGFSLAEESDLCARVFLARSPLQGWNEPAGVQSGLLGSEADAEQAARLR